MQLSCPCCGIKTDLAVLLTHEQARRAVARLATVSLPFGAQTLQYMALFKPASRALSIDRMVRLIEDMLPDIERRAITRAGRDWAADVETWRAALGVVIDMRDAGKLRLPLADHGLLYQVIANMADQVERTAESTREAQRRQARTAGPRDVLPRNLSQIAADAAASAAAAIAAPAPAYTGPSRAALEIRAQMEAVQRARTASTGADPQAAQQEGQQP